MRLYISKTEAEKLVETLQPYKDDPVLSSVIEYLTNRKDLPPLKTHLMRAGSGTSRNA